MLHEGHEDMLTNPARVLHLSARSPPPGDIRKCGCCTTLRGLRGYAAKESRYTYAYLQQAAGDLHCFGNSLELLSFPTPFTFLQCMLERRK